MSLLPVFLSTDVTAVNHERLFNVSTEGHLAINDVIDSLRAVRTRHKHSVLVHLGDGLTPFDSLAVMTSFIATDFVQFA